ncbi:MAG: hypothetical protein IJ402_06220 [Bacteroidales bacterium]|nr:hypothetical protein [Bacteroidales bacterium]
MSTYFKIVWLISSITVLISSTDISAQESDREQVLADDIYRLGQRALRDRIISEEEHAQMLCFVRDSLPEGTDLKVRALEQIRDELDEKYAEQVRQAQKLLDEMGYLGRQMLPDRLDITEDYVSPEEERLAMEQAAIAGVGINMKELLKYVKPLPMKPWLMTTLRLLFGRGVSQRPQRWDYTVVPQMGGVYDIIMPGGRPDDSWRDAPKMFYNPHPDKHFRR